MEQKLPSLINSSGSQIKCRENLYLILLAILAALDLDSD